MQFALFSAKMSEKECSPLFHTFFTLIRSFHSFWKEWKCEPHFLRVVRTFLCTVRNKLFEKLNLFTKTPVFGSKIGFSQQYISHCTPKKCALPLKSAVCSFTLFKKSEMSNPLFHSFQKRMKRVKVQKSECPKRVNVCQLVTVF